MNPARPLRDLPGLADLVAFVALGIALGLAVDALAWTAGLALGLVP